MRIDSAPWGHVADRDVSLYTLANDQGMTVKVTDYGATVTSIVIPDAAGRRGEITCGFDTLDGYFSPAYVANAPYFGATVGRYASRMADARFTLDGTTYALAANNGPHHLHGGRRGFDKVVWDAETVAETGGGCGLRLHRVSPDGEEGYPGTLDVRVTYTLTADNTLRVDYRAETDRPTVLSLTNHTYFNLNGFQDTILDHRVRIDSARILGFEGDIPAGPVVSVADTVRDLRREQPLAACFETLTEGFEDYYVFETPAGPLRPVAWIEHAGAGRRLEVATTEPGMLFYTGRYTADDLAREDGTRYGRFRGFCCETSKFPNGPNLAAAPGSVLRPGEVREETTAFRLSW